MSHREFNVDVNSQPSAKTNVHDAKAASAPEFAIQRIYIRDLSFEAPHTPDIFRTDWSPEVGLDLDTMVNKIDETVFEVILKVTVTVKAKDKIAFLVEVQQAGIFTLKGFAQEQLPIMLSTFCPTVLFPYVREVVSDVVNRGTFPPLYLAPINFESLYQQHLEQQQRAQQEENNKKASEESSNDGEIN